jgi:hypothetical protein
VDSVKILWDGKAVPLRKTDFKHLVGVALRWGTSLTYDSPEEEANLFFQPPLYDNDAFLLKIGGGDGAGSFTGYWMISRQGVVGFTAEGPP